jgi:hypothetical protein
VAFPGLRRGRNVYFTYRTAIFGKGVRFTISSRYKGFGDVARSILQSVDEDVLDITSIDVRDYFAEKRETGARVLRSEIRPVMCWTVLPGYSFESSEDDLPWTTRTLPSERSVSAGLRTSFGYRDFLSRHWKPSDGGDPSAERCQAIVRIRGMHQVCCRLRT